MKVYVGQTRASVLVATLKSYGFGECVQPREYPPRREPWFLDNGAFAAMQAGENFNVHSFVRIVRRVRSWHEREGYSLPDFVVVPDIVGQGVESLAFSRVWLSECRDLNVPCYLAVQDDMLINPDTVAGFDGVFVGGSLEWKLETGGAWVKLARALKMRCHVGRVGTAARVQWAADIGASSIDSSLPLWSSEQMDRFVRAVKKANQGAT
jgi:hypothetical protein